MSSCVCGQRVDISACASARARRRVRALLCVLAIARMHVRAFALPGRRAGKTKKLGMECEPHG
eukprot:4986656-Pleurochrysis_carterae.AAC.2